MCWYVQALLVGRVFIVNWYTPFLLLFLSLLASLIISNLVLGIELFLIYSTYTYCITINGLSTAFKQISYSDDTSCISINDNIDVLEVINEEALASGLPK